MNENILIMAEETGISMSTVIISSLVIGAVVLAGIGFKLYSDKVQRNLRAGFYRLLAKTLCDFFNKTVSPEQPYTEAQLEQMLRSGKHGGAVPELNLVKLRISAAENKHSFLVDILVYRGKELSTLRFNNVSWTELPEDIQSKTIQAAGETTEYLLLD